MRRRTRLLAAAMLFAATAVLPDGAIVSARAQRPEPPHAWLFGAWTGGLFPAPTGLTAEACLAQPVIIFTRELVLRATLTEDLYSQRLIAGVRATAEGFDLRFEPGGGGTSGTANLLGLATPAPEVGFGCETADVLHVERRGENEIAFPGCSDFPNPLVRCPSR